MAILETFVDILKRFWILWLGLFVVILYWFMWRKLDYTAKTKIRNFFSGPRLFIVLFIFGWVLWRKVYPNAIVEIHMSTFWMTTIGLFIIIIILQISQLRYGTRQLISPNFHACFAKRDEVNGFYIYPIGSINIFDVVLFTKGVAVVRKETVGKMSWGGDVSIARFQPLTNDYALDDDVKEFIKKTRYYPNKLKSPILYGWFDDYNEVDFTEEQLELLDKEKEVDIKLDNYIQTIKKMDRPKLLKEAMKLKKIATRKKKHYLMLRNELNMDYPSTEELLKRYIAMCKGKAKQREILDEAIIDIDTGADHWKRQRDVYGGSASEQKVDQGSEEI